MSSRQGGEGGKPKDDLLNRPYLIKNTTRGGGGGQKSPILRRHSLWTAPYHDAYVYDEVRSCFLCKGVINVKFMSPLLRKRSIFKAPASSSFIYIKK